MKQFSFEPDYRNIVKVARNEWVDRVPLYEHVIGSKVIADLTGLHPYEEMFSPDLGAARESFRQLWAFYRQMGYDTVSMEFLLTKVLVGGGALGDHKPGCIKERADFERYPWDEIPVRFFEAYAPYLRLLEETRPAGMKAVGGVGNGLFEVVQDLVGYIDLCFIREDDPDLYRDLFARVGDMMLTIWERLLAEFSEPYCLLRFGDDLGFNTMTLISADDIRSLVIPQYRRVIDRVHAIGKPFLLHSCGNLFKVFDDLIDGAGFDAKHSNEDSIAHFSVWVEKYGDRIGNFGGIDTDVLCRYPADYIRSYVLDCLEKVKGHGGIAFSSGNSIPDYVPAEGYLAMVETVREWRGDKILSGG